MMEASATYSLGGEGWGGKGVAHIQRGGTSVEDKEDNVKLLSSEKLYPIGQSFHLFEQIISSRWTEGKKFYSNGRQFATESSIIP